MAGNHFLSETRLVDSIDCRITSKGSLLDREPTSEYFPLISDISPDSNRMDQWYEEFAEITERNAKINEQNQRSKQEKEKRD